jgi:hypothetical protein
VAAAPLKIRRIPMGMIIDAAVCDAAVGVAGDVNAGLSSPWSLKSSLLVDVSSANFMLA